MKFSPVDLITNPLRARCAPYEQRGLRAPYA